jgi:hypothetical protein
VVDLGEFVAGEGAAVVGWASGFAYLGCGVEVGWDESVGDGAGVDGA